jgi:hypothetical protein
MSDLLISAVLLDAFVVVCKDSYDSFLMNIFDVVCEKPVKAKHSVIHCCCVTSSRLTDWQWI